MMLECMSSAPAANVGDGDAALQGLRHAWQRAQPRNQEVPHPHPQRPAAHAQFCLTLFKQCVPQSSGHSDGQGLYMFSPPANSKPYLQVAQTLTDPMSSYVKPLPLRNASSSSGWQAISSGMCWNRPAVVSMTQTFSTGLDPPCAPCHSFPLQHKAMITQLATAASDGPRCLQHTGCRVSGQIEVLTAHEERRGICAKLVGQHRLLHLVQPEGGRLNIRRNDARGSLQRHRRVLCVRSTSCNIKCCAAGHNEPFPRAHASVCCTCSKCISI